MRRFLTILFAASIMPIARAQGRPSDEAFFDAYLPFMIVVGVLIVLVVVFANVVAARRKIARINAMNFGSPFVPPTGPVGSPRIVTRRTTTTNADGSVTVTVVEETLGGAGAGGINGVVDPELFGKGLHNGLEEEILNEVRDAFRRIDPPRDS